MNKKIIFSILALLDSFNASADPRRKACILNIPQPRSLETAAPVVSVGSVSTIGDTSVNLTGMTEQLQKLMTAQIERLSAEESEKSRIRESNLEEGLKIQIGKLINERFEVLSKVLLDSQRSGQEIGIQIKELISDLLARLEQLISSIEVVTKLQSRGNELSKEIQMLRELTGITEENIQSVISMLQSGETLLTRLNGYSQIFASEGVETPQDIIRTISYLRQEMISLGKEKEDLRKQLGQQRNIETRAAELASKLSTLDSDNDDLRSMLQSCLGSASTLSDLMGLFTGGVSADGITEVVRGMITQMTAMRKYSWETQVLENLGYLNTQTEVWPISSRVIICIDNIAIGAYLERAYWSEEQVEEMLRQAVKARLTIKAFNEYATPECKEGVKHKFLYLIKNKDNSNVVPSTSKRNLDRVFKLGATWEEIISNMETSNKDDLFRTLLNDIIFTKLDEMDLQCNFDIDSFMNMVSIFENGFVLPLGLQISAVDATANDALSALYGKINSEIASLLTGSNVEGRDNFEEMKALLAGINEGNQIDLARKLKPIYDAFKLKSSNIEELRAGWDTIMYLKRLCESVFADFRVF